MKTSLSNVITQYSREPTSISEAKKKVSQLTVLSQTYTSLQNTVAIAPFMMR